MPTATAPTTLPARPIPELNIDPVPAVLGFIKGELGDLARERKEAVGTAIRARTVARESQAAVEAAAEADRAAFLTAANTGKKDPGRVHELAAVAASEKAHREAEKATILANSLADQLKAAARSEAGEKAIAGAEERAAQIRARLLEHLKPIDADVDALAVEQAVKETLEEIRDERYRGMPGGRPNPDRLRLEIRTQGGGNLPATHAVSALREFATPEQVAEDE